MKNRTLKILILCCTLFASLMVFMVCKGNPLAIPDKSSITAQSSLEKILVSAHVPEYHYQIINTYPHNKNNFTEGLLLENGYLYESSGLYRKSRLQKIEVNSGKILQTHSLPPQYFAEGITIFGDQLYQLTYREQTGFIYDKNTFALQKTFHYTGQGWGLTTDNKQLIMSNGSATLSFIDPQTLKISHSLLVAAKDQPIQSLNELEYINGKIYANVWPTSIIIIISPENGRVEGWFNISALKPTSGCTSADCVANGIAYNEMDDTLLVTGKLWSHLYAIKIYP
ncbi:MAG: glutaminyl-peptide cyclotransferase [Gammaproteobacteria bacterium]|nr:glutaminyl-peptide cyclotransferase [Gammaproteobacteria bacterium]MCW5582399.1 glutaminyl-peptide cyclotransferase [Gammaproteobacteria bacterium]